MDMPHLGPDDGLRRGLQALAAGAEAWDMAARFPPEALAVLRDSGLLAAPMPRAFGGRGLGTEPEGAAALSDTLRVMGATWLPLARVYEGHVNALRLIVRYGSPPQQRLAAADAPAQLFAIWAAEQQPVILQDGILRGRKTFASAAGIVTRPLVTASLDGAERLVLLRLPAGEARVAGRPDLAGMRGAGTAAVNLDGVAVAEADLIGGPGDYMRQPEISLGAWRALPGLLGGMQAVTDLVSAALRRGGRGRDPMQRARFGQMLLACETAALWVDRVAVQAEAKDAGEAAATAVKLARHAVDQACGVVLDHARRAIGLGSYVRPHPVERICRDIDTYRRQPALDEVLLEAADHRLDCS